MNVAGTAASAPCDSEPPSVDSSSRPCAIVLVPVAKAIVDASPVVLAVNTNAPETLS